MKLTTLLLSFLAISSFTFGQIGMEGQCGYIQPPSEITRLLQNKTMSLQNSFPEGGTKYIPIQFHIVGTDNGGGYIPKERIFDALCKLNEDFSPTDLQFYINDVFNYINNTSLYDLEYPDVPFSANQSYLNNKVNNAINIFIGNGLSSGNSGYYTSSYDIIYMGKNYVNDDDNILAHEMGHFFSLAHPFFGWENTPYDSSQPTPTTVVYYGNTYNVEYVDRTINCENSGDYLCGTPADYILDWGGGCDYQGGAVDPDSVLIDPDEANYMGYYSFTNCPQYHFSDDQVDVIMADYFSRAELTSVSPPSQVVVTDSATLISPINDVEASVYTSVDLEWEAVPDATHYLVELTRVPNFIYNDEDAVVSTTQYTATRLFKNKDYMWRVWAFNKAQVCIARVYSEVGTFSTGNLDVTGTTSLIKNSPKLIISPNPSTPHLSAVNIWAEKNIPSVHFEIFDAQGKLVFEKKQYGNSSRLEPSFE